MRANISNELINAIDERIYLDLEIHILTQRLSKAQKEGNDNTTLHLDQIIHNIIKQRKEINDYLKINGVKIYDVVRDPDGEFVEYPYSVKVNGGYKEGTMRYWRYAIKYALKKRISKYFNGGE